MNNSRIILYTKKFSSQPKVKDKTKNSSKKKKKLVKSLLKGAAIASIPVAGVAANTAGSSMVMDAIHDPSKSYGKLVSDIKKDNLKISHDIPDQYMNAGPAFYNPEFGKGNKHRGTIYLNTSFKNAGVLAHEYAHSKQRTLHSKAPLYGIQGAYMLGPIIGSVYAGKLGWNSAKKNIKHGRLKAFLAGSAGTLPRLVVETGANIRAAKMLHKYGDLSKSNIKALAGSELSYLGLPLINGSASLASYELSRLAAKKYLERKNKRSSQKNNKIKKK